MVFLDALTLNKPEIFIGNCAQRIDEKTGKITDEQTIGFIKQQLAAFAKFIASSRRQVTSSNRPNCGRWHLGERGKSVSDNQLNVIVICGSLRKASYNAALARTLPALAPPGMAVKAAPGWDKMPSTITICTPTESFRPR